MTRRLGPPDVTSSADSPFCGLSGPGRWVLLPPRGGGTGPSPLLLFAHGNAELIDHWPGAFEDPRRWGLAVLLLGVVFWLCVALVNAENQRYAMMTNKCPDPVFAGSIDKHCLVTVRSRDHWWEHLGYAITHVSPEGPPKHRAPCRTGKRCRRSGRGTSSA